jgi:hypothetical protein
VTTFLWFTKQSHKRRRCTSKKVRFKRSCDWKGNFAQCFWKTVPGKGSSGSKKRSPQVEWIRGTVGISGSSFIPCRHLQFGAVILYVIHHYTGGQWRLSGIVLMRSSRRLLVTKWAAGFCAFSCLCHDFMPTADDKPGSSSAVVMKFHDAADSEFLPEWTRHCRPNNTKCVCICWIS